MYLQLFPPVSHPHYLRLLQTYSQSKSAEHIFPLYQLFLEICFPGRYYCQTMHLSTIVSGVCLLYKSFCLSVSPQL
ncbi:hypothetical protein NP493_1045g00045 [Ridgeia piscesae]|uniref:Uncharacterized protein n=1 Tax=Ridgeia piscesae TaxID=27915 RepID=A0AAD9KHV0_RIDPI|nr:hypothetical protein NP493_1045g00045 [Ridgeia piscesae]